MTLRLDILRLLTDDCEGDRDARDLAQDLRVPLVQVQRELHAMARAGLLEPRAYRLHRHERAADLRGLTPLERRVVLALVEKGPLSRDALALSVGEAGASGGLKEAVAGLRLYGQVSPPSCPWASEAGRALVGEKA